MYLFENKNIGEEKAKKKKLFTIRQGQGRYKRGKSNAKED